MRAEAIIILSAFIHAGWNSFAKKNDAPYFEVIGIMSFATIFSLCFIPLFPKPLFANSTAFLWSLAAGVFEAGYVVTLAISLAQSSLGKSYILMRGGAMILVWYISTSFLGETINPFGLMAISVIMIGLILTSQTFSSKQRPQLLYPLLCSVCIAGYHLCYGRSLVHGANPAALFSTSMWVALPGVLLLMRHAARQIFLEKLKTGWKRMSFGGALSALSFLLFLLGLRYEPAGLALTLRNTSVVFAQIFAYFIGEKITPKQWLGALLVSAGACMLYP